MGTQKIFQSEITIVETNVPAAALVQHHLAVGEDEKDDFRLAY